MQHHKAHTKHAQTSLPFLLRRTVHAWNKYPMPNAASGSVYDIYKGFYRSGTATWNACQGPHYLFSIRMAAKRELDSIMFSSIRDQGGALHCVKGGSSVRRTWIAGEGVKFTSYILPTGVAIRFVGLCRLNDRVLLPSWAPRGLTCMCRIYLLWCSQS